MPLLPTDRPLTLDDFRPLERGTVVILHYCAFNKGTFVWLHERVEGDRVEGQFAYNGEKFSPPRDYLYECDGRVCQGSGAEPVWAIMPDGEPADTLVDGILQLPQYD
ncbi:hypothetical protein HC931_25690 [Candidatus Gracilibacteria bacterium]|nr:hypothetical protein [Candidatus Gracilibacteria bacterium]NJM90023.1 hypothetical protein [Hydrococcus sp. RU_2_2]NJP21887.1 hypothetical protein [Hydrococcus sp. CRU_1_1]NJQ96953.1 hypothetical protein [Hydrococcus sp. CSU_1_8]